MLADRTQLNSLEDTETFAQELCKYLKPGIALLLDGPLGAGKTTLIKYLVSALGGDSEQVCSPSFTLMHIYDATIPIVHIDAYRLNSPDELDSLGYWEYSDHGVLCIEWSEKILSALNLQQMYIALRFTDCSENSRVVHIETKGVS